MELFALIMYILSFLLLLAAAFAVHTDRRHWIQFGWLGLACWLLPTLVATAKLVL